ncbi:McrB family protein [Tahibacter harae]|uniref:AAA family ATPase n=1 Tax=Tahibacter harae TaxID=2963937 RepID=A0ABT1QP80_9GAMM|nr:AAA family ATPase [Tahibacter harae]MCQ4164094.1 AAA family ATPase [Tahibacter harae]
MARYGFDKNLSPVIEAAQSCVRRCLIGDGSVFSGQSLWTAQGFAALDRYFVQQPDEGQGTFYEKLRGQLAPAPPEAVRLMAEALWLLLLFPSNISADTKRENCIEVWSWSGAALDPQHPLLADAVLRGIGSAGMGMNTNRWREVNYLVGLGQKLKALPPAQREAVFASYDSFTEWLATVPQEGERQFRHMLRYFLFPDQVERMSSNRDRRSVLAAYAVADARTSRNWSDRQLDEALLSLRRQLEAEHQTDKLDFYAPPLRARWKPDEEEEDKTTPATVTSFVYTGVREPAPPPAATARPARNVIYYGPPGTGKTEKLRELFNEYTDPVADIDRRSWEVALVAEQGWRAVIAVALAQLGGTARVGDIAEHGLILAKAAERRRSGNLLATLWGYLQSHSDPDSATIAYSNRREPFLFDKDANAQWRLLPQWRERDPEAARLLHAWEQGPGAGREPVRRYRVVTFHPSYSYEDFVIGLRPVTDDDAESAAPRFALVDGVFKQICQQARANPARRYALFIDEINRANIAKVFGELITLVEADKRARYDADGRLTGGLEVQLPGAGELLFGVPANLDIYGSMNTADRSIALLDIALRRRFTFEELAPRYEPLDRAVAAVHLGRLLQVINRRLEYLLDRDHCIGHGYLWNVSSLEELQAVFARQILPLLQEYFFDDWSRVAAVLSDADGACAFLREERVAARSLFGRVAELEPERRCYRLTPPQDWSAEVFRGVYEGVAGEDEADIA